MGVSTDGQLSFGVIPTEDSQLPWDDDKYEGDIEVWWRDVRGFVSSVEYPFDEHGNYKPGLNTDSPAVAQYYNERQEWEEDSPLLVALVNYCSCDYPMYMIAVKHLTACRGYPQSVDTSFLEVSEEEIQVLNDFCDEFNIEVTEAPRWWLSSLWC